MNGSDSGEYAAAQMVTVTFDRHDVVSILRTLREVVGPDTLRIVARAELARGE